MSDQQQSATRARTRQAIIDAAIGLLAQDRAATLGEIATAAGVGRTTLHRYFADRAELIAAIDAEGELRLEQAITRARLDEGTGAEALLRLCQEYFELGDLLSLVFDELQGTAEVPCPGPDEPATGAGGSEPAGQCTPALEAAVRRGQHDGSIDPGLPAYWLESILWAHLYTAWSVTTQGNLARYEVLRLTLRTFEGALAGPR
ncbi:TetR/AcrR family transcriptional regulator [Polymorphospora sp. NPDC051019]|uniref:TetR/AcrR family transcriptional regulator n=1 Tax=Polymorphospora sp. NPDC051019 TaxID=3155725 RepID=UPI0034496D3E